MQQVQQIETVVPQASLQAAATVTQANLQAAATVTQANLQAAATVTQASLQATTTVPQASLQAEAEQTHADEDLVLQKALDQAASSAILASQNGADLSLTTDYNQWLNAKLQQSLVWLSNADRDNVSIQVLVRSKSAARELVYYLRKEWPLDLSKTYLYEVSTKERSIYRVFYSEFDTLSQGRNQLEQLPESVKVNSPYLHSVYRMQKALL